MSVGVEPRLREGGRAGDGGRAHRQVGHAGDVPVRVALGGAEHVQRPLAEALGALAGRHDHGRTAVGDDAAVEPVERARDHGRGEHVVDADRVAEPCVLGETGPGPVRDRDLGELLRRRAVEVHVPLGDHRERAHGEHRAVRQLDVVALRGGDQPAAVRARARAVGDQRRLAHPGRDRGGGVAEERDERAAADLRRVVVARDDPQVLAEAERREVVVRRDREDAVDLAEREPRVLRRPRRGLRRHPERREVRRMPVVGLGGPDDGDAVERAHAATNCGKLTPSRSLKTARRRRPMRTSPGSTPTTFETSRTPSSSSTSATT